MWGSRAETYTSKDGGTKASSMKWHIVNEDSLEEREIEVGWGEHKHNVKRTYGILSCGGKKSDWMVYNKYSNKWYDLRIPLVFKDKININANGICRYCRKYKMRELGIEDKIEV